MAQVPEGQAVVLQANAATAPAIGFYDFLRRQLTPVTVSVPVAMAVETLAIGANPGELLIGGSTAAGPELLLGRLQGANLVALTRFATGLTGSIAGVAQLADQRWIVATSQTLFVVPSGGGTAQPLQPVTPALGCVDLAVGRGRIAVLAVTPTTLASVIYTIDLGSAAVAQQRVALRRTTAIAIAPRGYLVAEDTGSLFEIPDDTWAVTPYAQPGLGPLQGLLYDPFRKHHVLGYVAELRFLTPTSVSAPVPLPPGRVLDLDLAPHLSAFVGFGTACAGSAGLPLLGAVGAPYPGNDGFAVALAQALPLAPAALILGASQANLDLAPLGMDGCRLFAQPLLTFTVAVGSTGRALVTLPIPPNAGLIGGVAFTQFVVVDRNANRGGAAWSGGGRIRV